MSNNEKIILLASDHAGLQLKQQIIKKYKDTHSSLLDLGVENDHKPSDYPDYAKALVKALKMEYQKQSQNQSIENNKNYFYSDNIFGILICGSGVGISIVANRYYWIRAALCHSIEYAKVARLHNDANVLVLGARYISYNKAISISNTFINTKFSHLEKHKSRIAKINNLDLA